MTKIRTRIISVVMLVVTLLTMIPATQASAADPYNGGAGIANSKLNVYNSIGGTKIGTVYAGEGITILRFLDDDYLFIQYSTSNGPKKGYVKWQDGNVTHYDPSCVAKVTDGCNLYYGNSKTLYEKSGSVETGEIISVIAANDNWAYVEYNVNDGTRKRGYIGTGRISYYNKPSEGFDKLYLEKEVTENDIFYVSGTESVYSGPTTKYPVIGSVSDETVEVYDKNYEGTNVIYYIRYDVDG